MGHGKVMPPNTIDPAIIMTYLRHMCEKLAETFTQKINYKRNIFLSGSCAVLIGVGWAIKDKLFYRQMMEN